MVCKEVSPCEVGKIKGEFSTSYLWDESAAKRIYKEFPNVKIMICLRDPVERMFSQYLYHKNVLRKEKRGFIDVVEAVSEYTEKAYMQIRLKDMSICLDERLSSLQHLMK